MKKKNNKSIFKQPPEVIERWVRQKMFSRTEDFGRAYARLRHNPLRERKRLKALEGAFDELKKQVIRLEHLEYDATKVILNAAFYFLLIERDIAAIKWEAMTGKDPWKRGLLTRVILLILHEADLDKVTGKKLNTALDTLDMPVELKQRVNKSLRTIRKSHEKAEKLLGDLRNSIIAHRDPDALLQYRAIRNLNHRQVFELAGDFYEAADEFISIMPTLIARSGSLDGYMRQIIQRLKT